MSARSSRPGTPETNPSLVPWEELPDSLRDSSRRFADGIGPKLDATGYVALPNPLIALDGTSGVFTDAEVETLARMEHDRWSADLRRDGWTHGPEKDPAARTHNSLIPWEELSEAEREKDREAVRELPGFLAAAGYELCRPGTTSG